MTETPKRSSFVTVLAWIFIALSGFGTFIGIVQNVLVQTVFLPAMERAQPSMPPGMPAISVFMFNHLGAIFLAFLLVSAFVLICSIGLLRRWNWARLCFAGIMLLGIVWSVGGVVMQFFMFSSMQNTMQQQLQDMPDAPDLSYFVMVIFVLSAVFSIGFSVLYGWIAKRLLSAPIAAEFRQKSLN